MSPTGRGDRDVSVHLLGYLFDPEHEAIVAEQARLRAERRHRLHRMTEKMAADGYPVDPRRCSRCSPTAPAPAARTWPGRWSPRAWSESVDEAFATLLYNGSPYYVPKADTPVDTRDRDGARGRRGDGVRAPARPPPRPGGRAVGDRRAGRGRAGRRRGGPPRPQPRRTATCCAGWPPTSACSPPGPATTTAPTRPPRSPPRRTAAATLDARSRGHRGAACARAAGRALAWARWTAGRSSGSTSRSRGWSGSPRLGWRSGHDCPRRYRMTYLDRPPPPRGGARAHNTLGAVVHLALRALFDLPPGGTHAARPRRRWSTGTGAARGSATPRRPRPTGSGPATGWPTTRRGARRAGRGARGRAGALGVGRHRPDRGRGPGGPDRPARRRAGDRRLQDRAAHADRRPTPPRRRRWPSTRWPPSAPCAGPAGRWSCTTCPAARCRPGGTTTRRWPRTSAGPRRPPARAGHRDRRADGGGDPERCSRPGPRRAAPAATCGGSCPEGRAAAPEAAPWALLAP